MPSPRAESKYGSSKGKRVLKTFVSCCLPGKNLWAVPCRLTQYGLVILGMPTKSVCTLSAPQHGNQWDPGFADAFLGTSTGPVQSCKKRCFLNGIQRKGVRSFKTVMLISEGVINNKHHHFSFQTVPNGTGNGACTYRYIRHCDNVSLDVTWKLGLKKPIWLTSWCQLKNHHRRPFAFAPVRIIKILEHKFQTEELSISRVLSLSLFVVCFVIVYVQDEGRRPQSR